MLLRGERSGLAASIIAYFLNTCLVRRFGGRFIYTVSTVVEEILKSGLAILLGGDIILSHGIFGVAEALNDYIALPDKINARAAIVGAASHLLFGAVTALAMGYRPGLAVSCAIIIHSIYNMTMVKGD
ncbi:MAG: hypothetical protein QME46_02860 [Thermoanaerobacteraceae bacterium]|nr:hypothetical protein [Thermoanaerobacteraceae bacterium]